MIGAIFGRTSLLAAHSSNRIVPLAIATQQQVRTTFILKRRIPPRLSPKDGYLKLMKGNQFVYDFQEFVECRKKIPVQVILTEFVDGIGKKGDVVSVHPNKARNDLLLPKRAVYASPENLEKMARVMEEAEQEKLPFSSPSAAMTFRFLERRIIPITMNMDTPWILQKWHVKVALRMSGIHVLEEAITLPEKPISGPNVDVVEKKLFLVGVTINKSDNCKVRCYIHHWTADPTRLIPETPEDFRLATEPLFPEDADLIKSLPPIPLSAEQKKVLRESQESTKQPLWTILSR